MKQAIGILIVLLHISVVLVSQEKQEEAEKRILVILFNRFQLHTEIPLEKINEINEIEGDLFYPRLLNAFRDVLVTFSENSVKYVVMADHSHPEITSKLQYEMMGNTAHFMCNADGIPMNIYKELLDEFECDYLLTVNWYRIITSKATVKKKGIKKVGLYTSHFIDYDLFSREKVSVVAKSGKKFELNATEANLKYMGLRLNEMNPLHFNMIRDMHSGIISSFNP